MRYFAILFLGLSLGCGVGATDAPIADSGGDLSMAIVEAAEDQAEPEIDVAEPAEILPVDIPSPALAVRIEIPEPTEFPRRIRVDEAIKVIAPLKLASQGCGAMPWEGGTWWGMYVNSYREPVKTPWYAEPVVIEATYAYTTGEHHLTGVTLNRQEYYRDSREEEFLLWRRDLDQE